MKKRLKEEIPFLLSRQKVAVAIIPLFVLLIAALILIPQQTTAESMFALSFAAILLLVLIIMALPFLLKKRSSLFLKIAWFGILPLVLMIVAFSYNAKFTIYSFLISSLFLIPIEALVVFRFFMPYKKTSLFLIKSPYFHWIPILVVAIVIIICLITQKSLLLFLLDLFMFLSTIYAAHSLIFHALLAISKKHYEFFKEIDLLVNR